MAKEVTIIIHSRSGITQVFQPKNGKKGWRVTQRDGVQLMIIHEKDSGLRHEIPLAGVFYWTVATVTSADAGGDEYDRYCDTCKVYYQSTFHFYLHLDHDVRRICCGSSPENDHHPSCSWRDSESNQRIGQIVDIQNDDNGISFTSKLDDNIPPHLKRFIKGAPEPDQPGVGG